VDDSFVKATSYLMANSLKTKDLFAKNTLARPSYRGRRGFKNIKDGIFQGD
jgi:hypothetical protein